METVECLKTRRSRRVFLDKGVSDDLVREIVSCGVCAPSSMDCHPWEFVLVRDKEVRGKIAELKDSENREHILSSFGVIAVVVDLSKSPKRWVEDGVCCAMNILTAIHSLGLGGVYVTACHGIDCEFDRVLCEVLGLGENKRVVCLIPFGYVDAGRDILAEKKVLSVDDVLRVV